MRDRLQRIFNIQKKINKELLHLTDEQKQIETQRFVLAATAELFELLEEINWAPWKKKKEIINTNIAEEAIDIFKFFLNICIVWGLDATSFMNEFERKSMVVEQRFKQMKALNIIKSKNTKVCAIDLDGVLVQYPEHWIKFINKQKSKKFRTLFDVKRALSNDEYLQLKHKYRETGFKMSVPIYPGANIFTRNLKSLGYSIVVLTKRPYKKYFRLFADTKISLDKKAIRYDAILFDQEKHKVIVKEFPHLEFMIEDNRNIANEVSNWGYKCFLMSNIYNQGSIGENVIRVNSYLEVLNAIKKNK